MWKIYKNDSEDLAFSLNCLFSQAININEFKLWLDIVLREVNIEHLPDYFFNLVDFDKPLFHIVNTIGFVPHGKLSEKEENALIGIAYLRDIDVYDSPVSKEYALEALKKNPQVLEEFKRFFPFIDLPILE